MRREDWVFVETLHFLIDATPIDIRLDKLNDVDTDISGGTISEIVDLKEQDSLIRRIAKAKEVHVSFLGRKRRENYLLTAEDLENFRRIVKLYEWPELPSAKNGHPPLPQEPPPSTRAPESSSGSKEPAYAGLGGVTNPVLIPSTRVAPKYPEVARRKKIEGQVILQIVVRKDGSVGDIMVVKTPGENLGFEQAAMAAVQRWKYKPAMKDGNPVDVYFTVVADFRLNR